MPRTVSGRTEEADAPADLRRREIVDLAAQLFESEGYHQTSINDLADAAGVAKATFYHYFSSKASVLYDIHQVISTPMVQGMAERIESARSADELLRETVTDILRLMVTHRAHLRVFFEHHRELDPEAKAIVREQREEYEKGLQTIIERGREEGRFGNGDARLVSLAIFGMCNWAYQWFPRNADLDEAENVATVFSELVLEGLRTRPPGPDGPQPG